MVTIFFTFREDNGMIGFGKIVAYLLRLQIGYQINQIMLVALIIAAKFLFHTCQIPKEADENSNEKVSCHSIPNFLNRNWGISN